MSTGPKVENRGGARPGSGRKRSEISTKALRELLKACKKRAKKEGRTIDDVLLDIIYSRNYTLVKPHVQIQAIKLIKELEISKHSESERRVTEDKGPGLFLPEAKPDPAKEIPINDPKVTPITKKVG